MFLKVYTILQAGGKMQTADLRTCGRAQNCTAKG